MSQRVTRRQTIAGIASLTVASSLAGCTGGGDGDDGDENLVEMTDELVFDPETITISVGETVTWENTGSVGHSVTAYEDDIPDGAEYFASGGFDTEQAARDGFSAGDTDAGDIPEGESYEHTFETAGTYEYFCIPHEGGGMAGTVEVE